MDLSNDQNESRPNMSVRVIGDNVRFIAEEAVSVVDLMPLAFSHDSDVPLPYDWNEFAGRYHKTLPPVQGCENNPIQVTVGQMQPDFICTVCQSKTLVDTNTDIVRCNCSHEFHLMCFLHLVKSSNTCPLCRTKIINE